MMPAALRPTVFASIERLVSAWYDRERDGGAVLILLGLFVAVWTTFQIVSYLPVDLHPDPLEVFAWSRHPAAGYFKHPPLGAWIVAAWFTVFPRADWAFHLLGAVNSAVAFYFVYLIARRFLDGDKSLVVLLLMMLTPLYQFPAPRFGANHLLLLTWPIAVYCFLRAYETRNTVWSAVAGVTAALAMLGKYFSIYLIAGLIVAAIAHPRRWDYVRSPSPWISVAAGLIVLAPHFYWLVSTDYPPFQYAVAAHPVLPFETALRAAVNYLAGGAAYMALPFVAYVLAVRPGPATFKEALWPRDPERRMLAVLLWTPLVLPALTAPMIGFRLVPLWTMQGWFLLPILLLAPPSAVLPRRAAVHLAIAVLVINVAVLLAAPALAWMRQGEDTQGGRAYYRLLAVEATQAWRETTRRRLSIVAGHPDLAAAASFYSADTPDYIPGFNLGHAPWVTPQRLEREGWVALCGAGDSACRDEATRQAAGHPDAKRVEVEIVPRLWGAPGVPARFLVLIIPPRASPPSS